MRSVPALGLLAAALAFATAGCGATAAPNVPRGQILAVGAENEYANVISQIGGKYVTVRAIESNPNIDPHTYQADPAVAQLVGAARIVVQNGLGYDTFMDKIESASPSSSRVVIEVQKLLRVPDSTSNPHLWYQPGTMKAVARAVTDDLARLQPKHAAYFEANWVTFGLSLMPWELTLKRFAREHPGTAVAVTEPVGDYMLQAAGARIMTPFGLEADVMNGVDPAPQDVTAERNLISRHRVKALLYNQQVTDSLTASFLAQARRARIPTVGLYETMPTGHDYQSWMTAELRALERAVAQGISTEKLT
jgi:zinc/manganese transport system substrate-binding protein